MNVQSQIVFEERGNNLKLGDVCKFKIPTSVLLTNPKQCFLKFFLVVGSEGKQVLTTDGSATDESDSAHYFPWTMGQGGCANLIKNLVIRDVNSGVTLESITDYNKLNRVLVSYTKNESQRNLDELYYAADSQYVRKVNKLTKRHTNANGLSNSGESQQNLKVECLLALDLSGIFNKNAQPFPNFLCPLEIEILLEDQFLNVFSVQGAQLGRDAANFEAVKDQENKIGGYRNTDMTYKVDGQISGAQTSLTILKTSDVTNDTPNLFTGDLENYESCNFPFYNGMECVVECDDQDRSIIINSVEVDGNNRLQLNFSNVDFTGNTRNNPSIYVKVPDNIQNDVAVTISDMQMVVGSIQPNTKQISALESALKSSNGYGFNYKCFQDFAVNQSANSKIISNLINCRYKNCKSILSFWEESNTPNLIEQENLLPVLDSTVAPKNYQYKLQNELIPSRAVSLEEYNRTSNEFQVSPVHVKEIEQGIRCCERNVRSLNNLSSSLVISRGLVPTNSNFYYDMSNNEETRMNVEYNAQSKALLMHNYVYHLKTLIIKTSGKMIVE